MDLKQYFERKIREAKEGLKTAERPGFKLYRIEKGVGQVDITSEQLSIVRRQLEEYEKALEDVTGQGPGPD